MQAIEPKCLVVTGRPGSGKTTLSKKLSETLYLPRISRDEIKEGYVNTFGVKHDQLPEDTNGVVNQVWFDAITALLRGRVSVIIEAAFQHRIWNHFLPPIMDVSSTYIVVCELSAQRSAMRHLERGLANPKREFYHGDKRVAIYRETGIFEPGGEYEAPMFDVPTLFVSTIDGYTPSIDEIVAFVGL